MKEKLFVSHIKHDTAAYGSDFHSHHQYEITFVLNGTRRYLLEDKEYTLTEKSVIFIKKDVAHRAAHADDPEFERYSLYLTDEFINETFNSRTTENILMLFSSPIMTLSAPAEKNVAHLFSMIESEYKQCGAYSDLLVTAYITELLVLFLRLRMLSKNDISIFGSHTGFLKKSTEYVLENYTRHISLVTAAEHVHLTPSWFSSKFKAATGLSFRDYLVRIRIRKACNLLLDTDRSVTEIAFDCGFNDANYFGSAFKRIVGKSPREFRKSNGEKE